MSPLVAGRLGRLITLLVAAGLVGSLMAAPVVAAPPSRADAAQVVARGTVVARDAARKAVGQERPQANHATLPGPDRTPGATPDQSPGRGEASAGPVVATPLVAGPDLRSVGAFPGIAEAENVYGEPPDPWIAASPTHLVQSTNNRVRITNRLGTELVSMPAWALFGLVPSELDTDPRIVWDDVHDRWVGVLVSFQEDYSDNYLNLAVSEGTDPTGAWDVFAFRYADTADDPTFPDYPGIATSSDKIVLTANEFDQFDAYIGASILVVRWSDLLIGADPVITLWTYAEDNPGLFTIRPAINTGSSGPVHLVARNDSYQVVYARLTGTAPAAPAWQIVPGVGAFCNAQAPRQPGDPATITDVIDGRPTDAVWRQNQLAFVSTCAMSYDGGATVDDYVRITTLDTTLAAAAVGTDWLIGELGADTFMGGIGYSLDGTLFVSYSRSSTADHVSTYAAALYGGSWTAPILVDQGEHTYTGTRWGDYVGVATDPVGTAAVWQSNEVADASGMWETQVSRLVLDLVGPTVISAANQGLIAGTTVGRYLLPVKISWAVSDAGSGVARSWLSTDRFSAGMADARAVAGSTVTRSHWWKPSTALSTLDTSYQYGVEGEDGYGNVGTFVAGSRMTAIVYQQTSATYSTGWGRSSSTAYLGGSVRYSSTAGKYATFRTSGRAFGFVTTRASTRGKVKVYVDGAYKGTVTLKSSTTKYRNLAYVANFPTTGTHTIKLVVARGRVDVDAFVVIR